MKKSILVFGSVLVLLACQNESKNYIEKEIKPELTEVEIPVRKIYGLPQDSFQFEFKKVQKNQFLADILHSYKIDYTQIHDLVQKSEGTFDVTKLVVGKPYTIVLDKDKQSAKYFVYESNPVEYVVMDLEKGGVEIGQKPVDTIQRVASGTITSSLYECFQEHDYPVELAMEMAEIYAWTIDFYRISKNDAFKIIYNEYLVDGERIGVGEVEAVVFTHNDEDLYAYYYQADSKDSSIALYDDYFDEEGKSLRKAFLKSPIKFGRISSRYTRRRFHPVQKRYKAHLGTDYAAPKGTPILAVGDGEIIDARYKKYNGNYVKIRHNGTYTTQYLHMSGFAKGIKVGKRVKQGDVIGYVGSTGLATGPHVCFRFWKHGSQVDHLRQKFPAAKPIKAADSLDYVQHIEYLQSRLDSIQGGASDLILAGSDSIEADESACLEDSSLNQ